MDNEFKDKGGGMSKPIKPKLRWGKTISFEGVFYYLSEYDKHLLNKYIKALEASVK